MTQIFLDTDIIIDVLQIRHPFYDSAAELFTLLHEKKVKGFTSSVVFANLHYVLRKTKPHLELLMDLRKLRIIVDILPVGSREVDHALISDFQDFEDALQYFTALAGKMDALITRNKKDYRKAKIAVLSPQEFLSSLDQS